jgi:hypothetical protein
MLRITKNKKVLFEATDHGTYQTSYETEKRKPNTLYVLSEEDQNKNEGGLSNGEIIS